MADLEGGRHGADSGQPLDPGDWAGLPDLSKRAIIVEPAKLDPALEQFTWRSEVYEDAPGVRRVHSLDKKAQG
jgi:hypothetical protein